MVYRLEDQKKLLSNPMYQRRIKCWEKKEDGEEVLVERPLRTSKWWQQDPSGNVVMSVKVGSKLIEFEKGKAAISVGSMEKLPGVIDALIRAVRAGELDAQLSEGKGQSAARKVA